MGGFLERIIKGKVGLGRIKDEKRIKDRARRKSIR